MVLIKKVFTFAASFVLASYVSIEAESLKRADVMGLPRADVSELVSIEQAVASAKEDVKTSIAKHVAAADEIVTGKLSSANIGYDHLDANHPSTRYMLNDVTFTRIRIHEATFTKVGGSFVAEDKNAESKYFHLTQVLDRLQGKLPYTVILPGKMDADVYESTSLKVREAIFAKRKTTNIEACLEKTDLKVGEEYILFTRYASDSRTKILAGKLSATPENRKMLDDAVNAYYKKK